MLDVINGVRCTHDRLLANLFDGLEYSDIEMPATLPDKLNSLSEAEIVQLHKVITNFWKSETYRIPNIQARLLEVGAVIVDTKI